jgi:hypothetical protein
VLTPADGGGRDHQVRESERQRRAVGALVPAAEQCASTGKRTNALTRTRACGELRRELGVYILGAIAPADRSAVESHLETCADCRDQLADLAGLPALLRRIPLDEADSLLPAGSADGGSTLLPYRPLVSLLSRAAKRRRYRVWSELVAATAVLAAGAAAAYMALGAGTQQPASPALRGAITVQGSNPRDDANAIVSYAGRPWGIQLSVQVTGVAAGTKCVLEVTESSGQESEAGSWVVAPGDEDAWYPASSSVPVKAVRGFIVTAGARALVRVPAEEGANQGS